MDRVPIIDITKENLVQLWPSIVFSIKNCSFIALDLELSGIGDRKEIMAKSIDDRYNAMANIAKTRAILSMGISCFTLRDKENNEQTVRKFTVQTFNLLILCSENYVVEPQSLSFLVRHGFDFNRQYSAGLPYYRGNDRKEKNVTSTIRSIFSEMLIAKKPIVLHNGLVDLIFLYQNLYLELPTTLSTFLADLFEMFPSGIYDTKYFSEFKARLSASYLEYVFRKQQRTNADHQKNEKAFIHLQFPAYPKTITVDYRDCSIQTSLPKIVETSSVCHSYASYGWCSKGDSCKLSHCIDTILDAEDSKQLKKSKNKVKDREIEEMDETESILEPTEIEKNPLPATPGGHRAGYDAFMTGFSFATFWLRLKESEENIAIPEEKNKIYLCGKNQPLLIMKSEFSKISANHKQKWQILDDNCIQMT